MGGVALAFFWQETREGELKIKAQQLQEGKILHSVAWQKSLSSQSTTCLGKRGHGESKQTVGEHA